MTNNPLLYYKPGLTMDTPVPISMAAADWAILMAWFASTDVDGVSHIVYGILAPQVSDALYSRASLQATQAHYAERETNHPLIQMMGLAPKNIMPEAFAEPAETWVIECYQCKSKDEYAPGYIGELTCGHDGPRTMIEVKKRPIDEE